jgi:hypothetical protein
LHHSFLDLIRIPFLVIYRKTSDMTIHANEVPDRRLWPGQNSSESGAQQQGLAAAADGPLAPTPPRLCQG